MIDPISSLGTMTDCATAGASAPVADFSQWLAQHVEDVNTKLAAADTQVRALAVGDATNIHEVMIAIEKARLSLELVVQVRNKVLEAYQNVMQMQV